MRSSSVQKWDFCRNVGCGLAFQLMWENTFQSVILQLWEGVHVKGLDTRICITIATVVNMLVQWSVSVLMPVL